MMLLLAAWLHDLDPYAIQLWEAGPIRWYGLSYLLGFFLGYLLIKRVCRVGISTLEPAKVSDLVVTLAIGVVVGGRLGYVFFYQPSLLWQFDSSLPFWGVLAINDGGMASHGGILGTIIASGYYAWRHAQPWNHLIDLMAFAAPLGLGVGRVANFINGELYGRPCDPDFPLAVQFPQEMLQRLPRASNGWATDSALALQPVAEAMGVEAARWREAILAFASPMPAEGIPARRLVYRTLDQAMTSLHAGGARAEPVAAAMRDVLTYRHPSQLYAAALEGLLVFLVLALLWMRPRRACLIGSAFCISYACVRLFDELFRKPDEHLGFGLFGLTRGQWLSVPLLLLGVGGVIGVYWFKTRPMGSWRRGPWSAKRGRESF